MQVRKTLDVSPITSQLRWTRLDVIGLAHLHVNHFETFSKLHVTSSVHTHTHARIARDCEGQITMPSKLLYYHRCIKCSTE